MNESILASIRGLLGPEEDYQHFDSDIIIHINSALSDLTQLGVGPKEGFSISDEKATWTEFLGEQIKKLENARTYVYLSVKLVFDPPANAALLKSMESKLEKLEWRINVAAEE